jgi:hypothetical protein
VTADRTGRPNGRGRRRSAPDRELVRCWRQVATARHAMQPA